MLGLTVCAAAGSMIRRNRLTAGALFLLLIFYVRIRARIRNRFTLSKPALLGIRKSPLECLLQHGGPGDYYSILGVSRLGFDRLHELFVAQWDHPIHKIGRPRVVTSRHCLALALLWIASTCRDKNLALIAGLVPSTVATYRNEGLRILIRALRRSDEGKVEWPSIERIAELSDLVAIRHPTLRGIFAFMDGVCFPLQVPSDPVEQEANYNGWLHRHFCACAFLFLSDGTIGAASVNWPGATHDVQRAQHILRRIKEDVPEGYMVMADSGFPHAKHYGTKILRPLKPSRIANLAPEQREFYSTIHNSIIYARQPCEWGMHVLQGKFPRLQIRLTVDRHRRARLLKAVVHMFNFATRVDGINQITHVFAPEYEPPLFGADGAGRLRSLYFQNWAPAR